MKKFYVLLAFLIAVILVCTVPVFAVNESEDNNTAATATAVSPNTSVTGVLSSNSDVDWYKFTVPQDGYFNITFQHELIDNSRTYWQIRLYDSTGTNYIDGNSSYFSILGNSNGKTNTFGVKAGTYLIKITDDYYSEKPYTFQVNFKASSVWETENNNSKNDADAITVNTTYHGSLSTDGDVDWYQFQVTEGGYFVVDFQHELIDNSRTYWQIRLYDESGVNYIDGNSSYFGVAGNSNCTTNAFGVAPGTYYIKLNDDYYSGIDYSICVKFTPSADWESENNNSKDTADRLALNHTYNGSFSTDGDVDWYQFNVTENGYFVVDFQHELIDNSRTYWQLRLYDATGVNYIDGNNSYFYITGNSNCVTNAFGVTPGTYYIKLNDDYYSGVNYTISVNFVAASDWEKENNSSKETASSTNVNSSINGSLSTNGDTDWYCFTVPSPREIAISLNHALLDSGKTYWVINLYDSTAVTKLLSINCQGNVTESTTEYITLDSGTYYVRITKDYYAGDTYTLTVMEKHDCTGVFAMVTPPSCLNDGVKQKHCEICKKLLETAAIPATGHTVGDWIVDVAATCELDGMKHGTCSACGATVNGEIPATGHTAQNWTVDVQATCLANGTQTKYCAVCDEKIESASIPATGHTVQSWTIVTEATCIAEGMKSGVCSACNETLSEVIAVTEHSYGEWEVTFGNKLIPPVIRERSCSTCDASEKTYDWSRAWIAVVIILLLCVFETIFIIFKVKRRRYR